MLSYNEKHINKKWRHPEYKLNRFVKTALKFNLGASIYYQYSTDIIQRVSILEERTILGVPTDITVRQPVNLNDETRYGFEFTTNYNPSKKVRLSDEI